MWRSVAVNRNVTSLTLQLSCNTEYDIVVTSMSGYGESALNESKIWNFKTGGGNHSFASWNKDWELQKKKHRYVYALFRLRRAINFVY